MDPMLKCRWKTRNFSMILNQGPLLEAFSTAGLEGWLGTAKPKGDTIRLITTSSHVLPMCICPPKKLLEMSAPLLHVSCTWIGLPLPTV